MIVIASLVIGSIFLGSHLLVHVLRYLFPGDAGDGETLEAFQLVPPVSLNGDGVPKLPPPNLDQAREAYRISLHPDLKTLSQRVLVSRYGITKKQAEQIQHEVKMAQRSEEPAEKPR